MIEFSIHGNQENENGNPLAKARFTRRQIFAGYADKYQEWLEYVRGAFFDAVHAQKKISAKDKFDLQHLTFLGKKPIPDTGKKARMEIFITWGAKTHADPENVFGSIADALFEQDKYLAGAFDFDERVGKSGRVDVRIWLQSPESEESKRSGSSLHTRKRKQVEKQRDQILPPKRGAKSTARKDLRDR